MAATVTIRHWTGSAGSPTKTDVTSATTMFVTDANHYASGTTNPVPIPASSTNYSYWVPFRLQATTTPSGTINNIKVYTDGSSGYPANVAVKGNTATSYIQPTGTEGTTGDILNTTNYTTLAGVTASIFGWTSGASKSVTGSLSNPSTGDFGDFVVVQMEVPSTVTQSGETAGETLTWVWDET